MVPALITALDERFGPPDDAYVNGSQVWLREVPAGPTLEWRLHPVPGYRRPDGLGTYEVFEMMAEALAQSATPPAPPERLWDGLEAFPAYGDEVEPAILSSACTDALGIPPEACGLVNHGPVGDAWERSQGRTSIVDALMEQLQEQADEA